jgi:ribosomal-protein-alanine N-acetyltransferase
MDLRPVTRADLPAVADLHARCFAHAWDAEFLGRMLAQPGTFCILATQADVPAGFAIGRAIVDEAEILSLGVEPGSRRNGLGVALARAAASHAAMAGALAMFLEVSAANRSARTLYERLGFREVGHRPAYYADLPGPGSDAVILRCSLPLRGRVCGQTA